MYHKNNFKFKYIVIINYLIYILINENKNFVFILIFKERNFLKFTFYFYY